MKKYKILFLIDELAEFGGAEKNLLQVTQGLNSFKYDIIICCLHGGRIFNDLQSKGINVINFNIKKIYGLSALKKVIQLVKLLRKEKVKLMVTYLESSDFLGSVVGRICGVPILISSRRDMGHNLKIRHIYIYRILNQLFDKIITVSDSVRTAIIKREWTRSDKVITIYNGVNVKNGEGTNNADSIRDLLGLKLNVPIITMIANLHLIKGHEFILEAFSIITKKHINSYLLLVGNGKREYLNKLKERVNILGIANKVLFLGFRLNIPEILKISDITVLSSISEGFSNTILEYMAAGKAVVATNVGGNKELVVNYETGFLVEPKNSSALAKALTLLLDNQRLRETMGENGKDRIKKFFTQEKMIQNLENIFSELIIIKDQKVR
ncbi:MAG: glycosyltransferase [Nanoarchaeota archaeon]